MRPGADLTLRGHAGSSPSCSRPSTSATSSSSRTTRAWPSSWPPTTPGRFAGLVLTSCEAFDNYPPGLAGKAVGLLGRLPGGLYLAMQQLRLRPLRRSPLTYGWMSRRPIPDAELDAWLRPLQTDRAIRRDVEAYVRHLDRRVLVEAAERLRGFDRPALVAWAADDKLMPVEHGRRLAALLPQGRFVLVPDSRTLIPLDQPPGARGPRARARPRGSGALEQPDPVGRDERGDVGGLPQPVLGAGEDVAPAPAEAAPRASRGPVGVTHRRDGEHLAPAGVGAHAGARRRSGRRRPANGRRAAGAAGPGPSEEELAWPSRSSGSAPRAARASAGAAVPVDRPAVVGVDEEGLELVALVDVGHPGRGELEQLLGQRGARPLLGDARGDRLEVRQEGAWSSSPARRPTARLPVEVGVDPRVVSLASRSAFSR